MKHLFILLKGMAMGIAETIPGVSGGTIAFITGIYDKLINSIKAFNFSLLKTFKNGGIKAVWQEINGTFLISLLGGMVIGIGIGVLGVEALLVKFPPAVWAFFFGLIIASIIYIGKQITKWNIPVIAAFVIGAVVAYGLTMLPIADPSDNLLFVFICGAVAVSALILPGISGSFILLIMGMYSFILHDTLKEGLVTNHDSKAFIIMLVFGIGMIVGLATISRFLSWALKKYNNITLAILSGFMLGALNKLWPWRIPKVVMDSNDNIVEFTKGIEVDKIIKETSVSPNQYLEALEEPTFLALAIVCFIVGFALVLGLDFFSKKEKND
jgi:putative membrane protein